MATTTGTRAVLAALIANLGIAIAKFLGFFITHSSSMLAEAVHSVADATNQTLLLLGARRAKRPATPEHPFGYARERYFWSFVVAVILFTLGSVFALWEGFEKLRHPHEISGLGWAIGILSVGIVLETWSFRTAISESNRIRGKSSWVHFVRRSKQAELPVVLLEDLGALIGLFIALLAVSLAEITNNPRWDGIGTVLIGILLGTIAVLLAVEMKSLLIGESASDEDMTAIRNAIERSASVLYINRLQTQHLGPEEILVATKVGLERSLDTAGISATIADIHKRIQEEVPTAKRIYIEPTQENPSEV